MPSPVDTDMNKAPFLLAKGSLTSGVTTPFMKVGPRFEL